MATVKDVAWRAGVSLGTVDRVLNERGRVASRTVERVLRACKELDYRPNLTARYLSMAKTFTFAALMPDSPRHLGYWELPKSGMQRAAADLAFYQVRVEYFHFDPYSRSSFEDCAGQVIEAEVDGIAIAPVITESARRFIDTDIAARGVPVVTFDAKVETEHRCTFVGENPFNSGRLAGKMLDVMMHEPGTVVAITLDSYEYHLSRRAGGFESYFEDVSGARVLSLQLRNGAEETVYEQLADALDKELPEIRGVFVTNALSHYIVDYLERRDESRHIPVIAYDLIEQNVRYLREGKVDFVISLAPEWQGFEAIYELHRQVLLGTDTGDLIEAPIELVTRENLDSHLTSR